MPVPVLLVPITLLAIRYLPQLARYSRAISNFTKRYSKEVAYLSKKAAQKVEQIISRGNAEYGEMLSDMQQDI